MKNIIYELLKGCCTVAQAKWHNKWHLNVAHGSYEGLPLVVLPEENEIVAVPKVQFGKMEAPERASRVVLVSGTFLLDKK